MEIGPAHSIGSLSVHRIYGAIQPISAIAPLTAGNVRTPADPSFAPGLASDGALQLYGRAADRIEAATAVRLGQILDRRA